MIQRRCPGCHEWYEKKEGACPNCGEPPAGFNKFLHTAQLNNHLFGMAEKAEEERKFARARGLPE